MSEPSSRFARWQKITIDQFGYSLNLIFGLTIAALAYWFFLLKDEDFFPGACAKCAMWVSLSTLVISALAGGWCSINRLQDFRGTAQRARESASAPSQQDLRELGRLAWFLLYIQVLSFLGGVLTMALALLLTYGARLF
jgi:hypothetical protein